MNGAMRFPVSLRPVMRTHSQGNGLGISAGKEDPVELDSSMFERRVWTVQRGGPGCVQGMCNTTTV